MTNIALGIFDYHQRTKHRFDAYAKGPVSLDWDDQPNVFRRFVGCEKVLLPLPGADVSVYFSELDRPEQIRPQILSLNSLGLMLELSFGLSAWKQFGPDRWALRCNPSSGNLHPTEVYVLSCISSVLPAGVYHYLSHDHQLERRCAFTADEASGGILIGLSSIHWREAWKYGERAFRYCQHDVGHALASLSYAAACLGWSIELLGEVADSDLARWLGLDREQDFIDSEHETPDILCRLHPGSLSLQDFASDSVNRLFEQSVWSGCAEALSSRHLYQWSVIETVTRLSHKPATVVERCNLPQVTLPSVTQDLIASRLIRQRRSAQSFNPRAEMISTETFQRLLAALLISAKPPFTAWNWAPQVDIILFVHRVSGLVPGLYCLPRASRVAELQAHFSRDFLWQPQNMEFPFYLLLPGNVRQTARTLSCHQPIASDSAFSLGMLARFAENIRHEPWRYRRLFWECGLLGQILYLEAEAAGLRGTGIGCFFDDAVHGLLELQDDTWQSLYHFTVGEPMDDNRLQTLPPYQHLTGC